MSAELNTIITDAPAAAGGGAPKRVKKPTLPAKFNLLLSFGYAFSQNLHSSAALSDEGLEAAYSQLKLFASVEDQTLLFQQFIDQSKETAKIMRKLVTARSKPVKVKPEKAPRKPRAKKLPVVPDATPTPTPAPAETISLVIAAAPAAPTPTPAPTPAAAPTNEPPAATTAATTAAKKPRAKKTVRVANDSKDDIIGQLAAAALNDTTTTTTTPKKLTKPRAPKPTPNTSTTNNTTPNHSSNDDDDIRATEIIIDNSSYLIDQNNLIYHHLNHNLIGRFDTTSQSILLH